MKELSFKLGFRSDEMNSLDLPVEIRKPNSVLVKRARSTERVSLAPGPYFVTTRLPAGQTITREVLLGDADETVTLQPDPEDEWDREWGEQRHFLDSGRPLARFESTEPILSQDFESDATAPLEIAKAEAAELPGSEPLTRLQPSPGRAYLRAFSGNLLQGECQILPPDNLLTMEQKDEGRIVYYRLASQKPIIVQLLEVGAPVLNLVVPPMARIAVSRRPLADQATAGVFKIEAFSQNSTANLLLRYNREGAYQRAGDAATPERMLANKVGDPVAAAIGAYSLLRIGELDRLHDWTANLYDWFPWLPDGAAIRGEHLARFGKHVDALAAFAALPTRGLPIVADGVFYAVERLRMYSRLKSGHSPGVDIERATEVLEGLNRYAALVHRQRPLTSFPGLNPASPDRSPLRPSQGVLGALEQVWLDKPGAIAQA